MLYCVCVSFSSKRREKISRSAVIWAGHRKSLELFFLFCSCCCVRCVFDNICSIFSISALCMRRHIVPTTIYRKKNISEEDNTKGEKKAPSSGRQSKKLEKKTETTQEATKLTPRRTFIRQRKRLWNTQQVD